MTTDEILQLIKRIFAVDGTEEEMWASIDSLDDAFPHSKISDIIFHDLEFTTPEQVVAEAMRREADYARKSGHR